MDNSKTLSYNTEIQYHFTVQYTLGVYLPLSTERDIRLQHLLNKYTRIILCLLHLLNKLHKFHLQMTGLPGILKYKT